MAASPKLTAFASAAAFRSWLEAHHRDTSELVLRLFKKHASARGLTYREALDEALCYGWIDGVIRALDEDSFTQRFTPRKPKSAWSAINVARFQELQAGGRVRPPGLAAFAARVKTTYSYESRPRELSPAFRKEFRAHARAWRFFEAQPPWYRRTCAFWVMCAKRPETRLRRLAVLITHSEKQEGIPALKPPGRRPFARRAP